MPRHSRSRWLSSGQRKLDHVVHAPRKGVVDVLAEVAGEDHHPVVLFDFLQQVGHFDVGVAVVRIS